MSPTDRMLKHFRYEHLPTPLQVISQQCCVLAQQMATMLPASAELTVGLRKLLEAKDCFVRAQLEALEEEQP